MITVSTSDDRQRVLQTMPIGIDLDIAQVSARVSLLPEETYVILKDLIDSGYVEVLHSIGISQRARYIRLDVREL